MKVKTINIVLIFDDENNIDNVRVDTDLPKEIVNQTLKSLIAGNAVEKYKTEKNGR